MAERAQMKRRPVFSDGRNAFSHVVFGMASAYIQVGVLVFVAYQMHDFRNANFVVDMLEFCDRVCADVRVALVNRATLTAY